MMVWATPGGSVSTTWFSYPSAAAKCSMSGCRGMWKVLHKPAEQVKMSLEEGYPLNNHVHVRLNPAQ
jgi:hypothetical protein